MPIRYNQSQGSRYQDEDDQLLGMFFGGLAQGQASYERAKDRRLEQDYRNKQYDLAKTSAQDEKDYRQSMLTEAKEGRKFEEGYKKDIYNLEKSKTDAAINASNEALEVSKLQRQEAGLKLGETTRQIDLGKAGTEAEAIAAEIQGRALSMPLGFDYDRTFTNDQILSIDPVNGQQYIDNRDKVIAEITSVAARMNQADQRNRPGDVFMLQMQQANDRADARITEALSKNQWSALSTDTMFGTNPFGPSADGKPQQPSQMQEWYTTTNAKVQSGALSYKDAMLEMAQKREEQIAYQGKLQTRSNFQEDLLAEINGLRTVIPNLKGPAKFMAQRQATEMTGILAQLQYTPDAGIADLAKKFGGIIGGQGQVEFGSEAQKFVEGRLGSLEGQATPEAQREREQLLGMVAQTRGFEGLGQAGGSEQGTPFAQAGAAFTQFMGLGGQAPAGPAVRAGDGSVVPGGGTPETPPVPKTQDELDIERRQQLINERLKAYEANKTPANKKALRDAEAELDKFKSQLGDVGKVKEDLKSTASSLGGDFNDYANVSTKEDYLAALDAAQSEFDSIPQPTYSATGRPSGGPTEEQAIRRGKLKKFIQELNDLARIKKFEE